MALELATWTELLPILRETFEIWAAGLPEDLYRQYVWRQINHPWSRKHQQYVVYRQMGAVVSCCKIYQYTFMSRGRPLLITGIGGVFTAEKERGKGYGKSMVADIVARAKSEEKAGVMLFSDIGEALYDELGFEAFSAVDFYIELDRFRLNGANVVESESLDSIQLQPDAQEIIRLETGLPSEVLDEMVRHYGRWLARQPFGFVRDQEYLAFKLGREEFLVKYSSLDWPKKTIWFRPDRQNDFAYAITENTESSLRILELIGPEAGRQALWNAIFRFALDRGFARIRGWEAVIKDFAPSFSLAQIFRPESRGAFNRRALPIYSTERSWGLPMLLPFDEQLHDWWNYFPCPFLELDHF
jgi:predicted N-acetyltransferase YhbS